MKVLQVNCVYKTGSTGKIMYDVHTELFKKGHKSVVCYGRGTEIHDENVYKTCGELYSKFNNFLTRLTGIMYGCCFFSTNKLISIIKKEKPDIVHLHCINGYFVNIYRLVSWLKNNKIKTVVTLHAEFMYTANCGHSLDCEKWKTGCGDCPALKRETKSLFLDGTAISFKKMKKAFDGFNDNLIITSVSPWLMERAKQSPILGDKNHTVVLNGLNPEVFSHCENYEIHNESLKPNQKIVLFVTPIFNLDPKHIKGAWYVVELARRMKDVNFVIIGSRDTYDNLPANVINVGRVENQDKLAEYYSNADVTLIASKRETFSMVLAESLCCGTPVVGFKAGGPETIAIDEYCDFVDYGDIDALEQTLKIALEKEYDSQKISEIATQKYKKQKMTAGYLEVYDSLLGANNS